MNGNRKRIITIDDIDEYSEIKRATLNTQTFSEYKQWMESSYVETMEWIFHKIAKHKEDKE